MKLNKYLKIFVVSFCFVALLAVSCFATSAQTTNVVYGHYISPGEYMLNETVTFFDYVDLNFNFISNSSVYNSLRCYSGNSSVRYILFGAGEPSGVTVYDSGSWSDEAFRYITVLDGFYIYSPSTFRWWQSNVTRVSSGYSSNLLDGFLTVFSNIGLWISSAAASLTSMFFAEGSLTFLGTLCIASLAIAVSFLLIGLISRFLRFRG